jgi:hypothetical protein
MPARPVGLHICGDRERRIGPDNALGAIQTSAAFLLDKGAVAGPDR